MKVIVGVGFAMLMWITGYYAHFLPVPKPDIYPYITLTLIGLFQPVAIFWMIKRNYESNNHLREQLEVTINQNLVSLRGSSFYTELASDKIFKVAEERDYLLIFQNTLSAIIISKKDLPKTDMEEVRKILRNIPNVPMHLIEKD